MVAYYVAPSEWEEATNPRLRVIECWRHFNSKQVIPPSDHPPEWNPEAGSKNPPRKKHLSVGTTCAGWSGVNGSSLGLRYSASETFKLCKLGHERLETLAKNDSSSIRFTAASHLQRPQ